MPSFRPVQKKKRKRAAIVNGQRRPSRPSPKLVRRDRGGPVGIADEVVRTRAEAEAAIAEARKSHDRLTEAIDILPQGIVFLDAEAR